MTKAGIYVFVVVLMVAASVIGWLLVRAEPSEAALLALGAVIGLGFWGFVIYSALKKTNKDD